MTSAGTADGSRLGIDGMEKRATGVPGQMSEMPADRDADVVVDDGPDRRWGQEGRRA